MLGFGFDHGWVPAGWYDQNKLTLCRLFDDYFFKAIDDREHRAFPEINDKAEVAICSGAVTPLNLCSKVLAPSLVSVVVKTARAQAFVDAARVACAIERYRLASGRVPGALDSLSPTWIARIPNDVMDGKPLRYRVTADGGYVVYSIGWNRTDDGGIIGFRDGDKTKGLDPRKGDWVWLMPGSSDLRFTNDD
jgi:hypothetical protein